MTRRWSPTADATLAYSSEILSLGAAAAIGQRSSLRLARHCAFLCAKRAPRTGLSAALRRLVHRLKRAYKTAMVSGGRW